MQISLIDYGQILFLLILAFVYVSYKRKFRTLNTYIGIAKIFKIQNVKVDNYEVVLHSVLNELKINFNNYMTLSIVFLAYMFLIDFSIISYYAILPIMTLVITFFLNKEYTKKSKKILKDNDEK